jgi:hypothetical protein
MAIFRLCILQSYGISSLSIPGICPIRGQSLRRFAVFDGRYFFFVKNLTSGFALSLSQLRPLVTNFQMSWDTSPCSTTRNPQSNSPNGISLAKATRAPRLGIATKAKHFEVVKDLPLGRIHATGKTAVPDISQELYDKLSALVGGDPGTISTSFAKSWEELAPGQLVVAQESIADGWWVAVVVERTGDTFTLKWRDDPSLPPFDRPITSVALLSSEPR